MNQSVATKEHLMWPFNRRNLKHSGEVSQFDEDGGWLRITPAFIPSEGFLNFMQGSYAPTVECAFHVATRTTTIISLTNAGDDKARFAREIHELLAGLITTLTNASDFSRREWMD